MQAGFVEYWIVSNETSTGEKIILVEMAEMALFYSKDLMLEIITGFGVQCLTI